MNQHVAVLSAALARAGRDVTLRRMAGTPPSAVDVAVRAVVRGFDPQQLAGGMIQGDRMVVVSNVEIAAAEWPGPPRKNDRVLIGDDVTTIQGVETVQVGDTVIRHNIHVRG